MDEPPSKVAKHFPKTLLVAYRHDSDHTAHALLISDGRMQLRRLRNGHKFRECFLEKSPPQRYSYIEEDVVSGTIKQIDTEPFARHPNDVPDTLVTEHELDKVFKNLPQLSKCIEPGFNPWELSDLLGFVRRVFRSDFLKKVGVGVAKVLGLSHNALPTRIDQLFIRFEDIQWRAGKDKYPFGADYVFLRRAIVKTALEDYCDLLTVALENSVVVHKALALALPFGAKNKGAEIFCPGETKENRFYSCGDLLFHDSGKIVWDREIPKGAEIEELEDLDDPDEYINSSKKTQRKNMAYVAGLYNEDATSSFFKNEAVVFSTHPNPTTPFRIYDFSNYFATVARVFSVGCSYLTRVFEILTELRLVVGALKSWIVVLIGVSKHRDPSFYHMVKNLSVAVMIHTISMNEPHHILGATTDGIMVSVDAPRPILSPAGFPLKLEFDPSEKVRIKHVNHYAGKNSDGLVVHRGCMGKGGTLPEWCQRVVSALVGAGLDIASLPSEQSEAVSSVMVKLQDQVKEIISRAYTDCVRGSVNNLADLFVLPETTMSTILPTRTAVPLVHWQVSEGLLHRWQLYTEADSTIHHFPVTPGGDLSRPPKTMSLFCLKNIDRNTYVSQIEEKIDRVSLLFDDQPEIKTACSLVRNEVVTFIDKVIPRSPSVYPGGVLCHHSLCNEYIMINDSVKSV